MAIFPRAALAGLSPPLASWPTVRGEDSSNAPRCAHDGARDVPLSHVDRPAYENMQGVIFPMIHDCTPVRVLVTHEALQILERSPPEASEFMGRFEANRAALETIASEKFDDGRFEGMVRITGGDLMRG